MQYEKPLNYILESFDLITHENKKISIFHIFEKITITEDIFGNFLHGYFSVTDGNDLQQLAPLIGEETIIMRFRTAVDTGLINLKFRTYRISTSDDDGKDRISHFIYFTSEEQFHNSNSTISKSFKSKSLQFIVSHALDNLNSDKSVSYSNFAGNYHIVAPNWSPSQLINYMTSIAKSKNFRPSLTLWYETFTGFQLKHIEDLISSDPVGLWKVSNAKSKLSPTDEVDPSNNIITYRIPKNSADVLKSMQEGLYSNAVIAYDSLSKNVQYYYYRYDKDFDKTQHLSKYPLNSSNFDFYNTNQRLTYIPTASLRWDQDYFISKQGSSSLADNKEKIVPYRTSILSQISAKQIELVLAGDSRLSCGKTINIEIPNVTALDERKTSNHRYNRKKVLITKIIHEFTKVTHKMQLTVMDDSYPDDLTSSSEFEKVAKNV